MATFQRILGNPARPEMEEFAQEPAESDTSDDYNFEIQQPLYPDTDSTHLLDLDHLPNNLQTFDEPRVRKRPDVTSFARQEAAHLRRDYNNYLNRQRRRRVRRDASQHRFLQKHFSGV